LLLCLLLLVAAILSFWVLSFCLSLFAVSLVFLPTLLTMTPPSLGIGDVAGS
jgi:hypothetical protein